MEPENMGLEGLDFSPEPEGVETDSAAEEIAEEIEETQTEETEEEQTAGETDAADQGKGTEEVDFLEIKYNGEKKKISKDETIALAQKGMNYDHIKEEVERLKEENGRRSDAVKVLERLARSAGQSLEDYVKTVSGRLEAIDASQRIKDIMTKHGVDEKAARSIDAENQERRRNMESVSELQSKLSQIEAERAAERIWSGFAKDHPEYKTYGQLPEEVRLQVKAGKTLEDAYNAYEVKQLKERLAKGEQQQKNKTKTPGSSKDAGASAAEMDPFMRGFLGNF